MKIKPLEPGSKRTLLSAHTGNELIHAINALSTMTGENGIQVTVSEGNVVIRFTGTVAATGTVTPPTVNATGTLVWGGNWQDIAYAKDVLVIVDEFADRLDGTVAGQYASILPVPLHTPKPGTPGSETFWQLSARGNWGTLIITPPDDGLKAIELDSSGAMSGLDDLPGLQLWENRSTLGGAKCLIRLADIASDGPNPEAKFRQFSICIDGAQYTTWLLATEPKPV